VLYLRTGPTGTDLYTLDLASLLSTRLTTSGTVCCSSSWSPDGKWIMYTDGVVDGTQSPDASTRVVADDGSSRRRLGPCCDVGWSDAGRAYFQDDVHALYSAAEDGTDVRLVPGSDIGYVWVPSPDGSAFTAETPQGMEILRPGKDLTSLTTDPADRGPVWSPDGAWIAFSGIRSGVGGVYVMPTNGGQPRLVASNANAFASPWRPGPGHAELTLIRDRAIIQADPAGGLVSDLVGRATIAGDPVEPAAGAGSSSTIVIGPSGPDRDIYHITARDFVEVRFTNRSQVSWAPYGLSEKNNDCRPSSCSVGPGGTLVVTPSEFAPGMVVEIRIAPYPGSNYRLGYPVIIDIGAAP
jgi:WD40-like Beta Propeller Repeat